MWGDSMATFAERIKQLRIEAGLSQEELAAKLFMSKGAIGNYETNKRTPRKLEDLENIADFFNVEIDYLLGRTNTKPEYSLEEKWILSLYRQADQNDKEVIKQILKRYEQDTALSVG